jgi:micrococcal nuclease
MKIKLEKYIIYIVLLIASAVYGVFYYLPNQKIDFSYATVQRVVDGDTILLTDGRRVRYIGIDTPESVKPNTKVECFAKEASNKNKELVEGKKVKLIKDITDKDKYGRLLRYVYIEDNFINEYMVKNGYAKTLTIPPNITHSLKFKIAEKHAREGKLGLWGDICK